MTRGGGKGRPFAVEDFVQAFTAQLDRAQDALALKARVGRPLTFALKDLSVDLHVFLESDDGGKLTMRHAGPDESGASTIRLSFTTITRTMVEENTLAMSADEDPRGLEDLRGAESLDEAERRRLEWAGVRTVGQFKKLSQGTDPKSMEAYLGIPVLKLRAALEQAARPVVTSQEVVPRADGSHLLRIRGANLSDGIPPEVKLSGEPVEVLEASSNMLLVRPRGHHKEGQVEVVIGAAQRATGFYRLPDAATALGMAAATGTGGTK
ncbi:hypothetical protein P2318_16635 [Myxococcaceae bacterium GXIMD 01537]